MGFPHAFRRFLAATLVASAAASPAHAWGRGPKAGFRAPPKVRPPAAREADRQDRLERWMEGHANLPLPQLLKELENLPGFRDNPAWEQQRLREQVTKLYNMQPQQRKKLLEENEALARMTSEQRQQFDGVMQQYSALSPDRQRLVRGAFAVLRKVPQRDRQAAMNASPSLKQFSAHERNVLSNLLIWEPYFTEKGP